MSEAVNPAADMPMSVAAAAAGPLGKPRNWLGVLGLSIITLGIYQLYWIYKSFQEMKDHTGDGIGGAVGLVIGIFVSIVNMFLLPSEISKMYQRDGRESPVKGTTGFWILIPIAGLFIWLYKVQTAMSDYWVAHGATK